jgi:hypothetical protein
MHEALANLHNEDDENATCIDDDDTMVILDKAAKSEGRDNPLTDIERRIWAAWGRGRTADKARETQENDTDPELGQRQASDTSESQNTATDERHMERTEAQRALQMLSEKAMDLYGIRFEDYNPSTESTATEQPKPASPALSRLSTALSFEQRALLEQFSSALKNEGIPVLKLGRRNKWQVRYLTVSSEVTRLESRTGSGEVGQCPQALLWPKNFNADTYSVLSVKENGRGGVFFHHLRKVRATASNEFYDRHLPKKLKEAYPVFAGVVLDYSYDGGERQLHFCFKSKLDSQAFITAMLIIKEATERGLATKNDDADSIDICSTGSATRSEDS